MNGDVGKKSCGDASPTSELVSHELPQDVSDPKKHGSESHPSKKMTDTMAVSRDEMLQDSSEAVCSAPAATEEEEEEVEEAPKETPNGESPEEKTKEAQGSSLPQEGGNDDTGQGLEEQPKTPQVVSEGSSQASKEPLTRDQIKELVSQNVEYFFSRENWSSDAYLLSQMDSDQYVPVYILANCSQFKSITKDHSIILDALKESVFVQLDEENNRVRPNYKRCIVILREIPELTPVKEIEAMFEGEGCPKCISCEFVYNGFWYVTFESDSDAQKAYRYLRETVKTFKDKPILARIKTKPMSRIGCLSVLPSYGGKPVGGETGERPPPNMGPGGNSNCLPPGGPPGNPGLQGIPNPPPPPPPNAYPPNNPQRMFYPSQNNMNASYPNYNFAASIQIPAAYFYPNPMMQWPTPNFYDINSFIQYNGLSPRATYKPPANTRFNTASNNTNNMNRRNKNRDPKNNDSRHVSGSGFNSGSQMRPSHPPAPTNRPHSSHSPHPYNHSHQSTHPNSGSGGGIHSMGGLSSIGNHPANQHGGDSSINGGSSTPKSIPPSNSNENSNTNNNSNKSTTIPTSANGFAQNDLSLASQSNLYTSFSGTSQNQKSSVSEKSETGDPNGSKLPSSASQGSSPDASPSEEGVDRVSNGVPPTGDTALRATSATSSSTTDSSPSFSQPTARSESNLVSGSQAPSSSSSSSSQINSSSGAPAHPPHHSFHHHPPAPPPPHPHPHHQGLPVSHRSSFNGSENPHIRDAQPQRQMSRGGRRRVSRREEEMNGHPAPSGGGGRGSQRTPGGGADSSSHKNAPNPEVKKPSFELQATSFPPLPSSEELAAAVPEEKTPDPPQQTPWAGETHKFSDVMKGTAKPKPAPVSSGADAESASSESLSPPQPSAATNASAEHQPPSAKRGGGDRVPNPSSSTSTSQSGTVPEPQSPSPSSRATSGVTGAKSSEPPPPPGTSSGSSSNSSFSRAERGMGGMRGGGLREERRSVGPVGVRRDNRDFVPGVGRGGVRRTDREGGGGFRFSGNKENRPAPNSSMSRSWREDRPDPDGWITKGPRDPRNHRGEQRYQHQNSSHQHNYYESRNSNRNSQPMVNGDRSPPPPHSPQPESVNENVTSTSQIPSTPKSNCSVETKQLRPEPSTEKEVSLNNNEGEHKTSWAKMALASKDQMERLSAELKEKEEQERMKKNRTVKPPQKLPERVSVTREREGSKPFRRENNFFLREREKERELGERGRGDFLRGPEKASTASSSSSSSLGFKSPREALVPKSPK